MIELNLPGESELDSKDKIRDLYKKYAGLIYYTATQLTDDKNEAEDILQETFVRIISKIDIIRTDNDREVAAFIYKVTRFCGIDYLRKKKNVLLLDDIPRQDNFSDGEMLVDAVYIKEVAEIIRNMDEMYSVPLQLKADGYRIEEIAQLLGLTPENVKVRIHRGRKMIKDRLEGGYE